MCLELKQSSNLNVATQIWVKHTVLNKCVEKKKGMHSNVGSSEGFSTFFKAICETG